MARSLLKEHWTGSIIIPKIEVAGYSFGSLALRGAPHDADESESRLRAPDFSLPRPEDRGWLRPGDRGSLWTEQGVRGEHPEGTLPQGIRRQPPWRQGRLRPAPAGGGRQ